MFDFLKLYNLYKAFAPALIAVASGVLAVQDALGVNHSTVVGTVATALLGLLGAHAVAAAHKANDATKAAAAEQAANPGT